MSSSIVIPMLPDLDDIKWRFQDVEVEMTRKSLKLYLPDGDIVSVYQMTENTRIFFSCPDLKDSCLLCILGDFVSTRAIDVLLCIVELSSDVNLCSVEIGDGDPSGSSRLQLRRNLMDKETFEIFLKDKKDLLLLQIRSGAVYKNIYLLMFLLHIKFHLITGLLLIFLKFWENVFRR